MYATVFINLIIWGGECLSPTPDLRKQVYKPKITFRKDKNKWMYPYFSIFVDFFFLFRICNLIFVEIVTFYSPVLRTILLLSLIASIYILSNHSFRFLPLPSIQCFCFIKGDSIFPTI